MAHTFGTNTALAASSASPLRTNVTIENGETVAVLALKVVGATDRTGGAPTLNGVPMTQANSTQKAAASPECSAELWYVTNWKPGTYLLELPNNSGASIYRQWLTGKAAPGMGSQFDSANGANATGTNPSPGSVTPRTNGAILFAIVATGAQTWAPSAQAGTSTNNSDDGAHGTGIQYYLQSTAGAFNLNWTFGTSDDYGAVVAAFVECPAVSLNNYNCCVKAGTNISVGERVR